MDKMKLTYDGGKGNVYQKLINLMPPHDVYIETHLGLGAVMRKKLPARRNIAIDMDIEVLRLFEESYRVNGVEFINDDAVNFLKGFEYKGNEFVYCDPPYLISTRRCEKIYKYEYTEEMHIELLELIKTLPCMVMISGYYSKLYEEKLKGWNTVSFMAKTRHGMAEEYVWMNYQSPIRLHDYGYYGDTFRERERIKKKARRWVTRLETMPVLERQVLLSVIKDFY